MKKIFELTNGSVCVGHTFNGVYLGVYDEELNALVNVMGLIEQPERNFKVIPPVHPAFLIKKFEQKLIEINFPISVFINVTDTTKIEFGAELVKKYRESTSSIVLVDDESKNKNIAEKIKKSIEEKENKEGYGKIIQS